MTDESLMENKTALELIDEMVPISLRGPLIGDSVLMSSCLGVVIKNYERVEVRKSFACSSNRDDRTITSVVINWKHRDCRSE